MTDPFATVTPQTPEQWKDYLATLPRPDLEGHRPSPDELQLWIGAAHGLLRALDQAA